MPATNSIDPCAADAATPGSPASGISARAASAENPSRRGAWLEWTAVFCILLAYVLFLAARFEPAIVSPDANGYWAQGSLIAQQGKTWFTPESPPQYNGMHWLVVDGDRYFSRYPPGLPLLVAAVYKLAGPDAGILVNPALALLSILGMWIVGRLLFGKGWGVGAMLLLACNPMFNRHALQCDSHMAVTALLIWGLAGLFGWSRNRNRAFLFLAGVLLGAIPTVRYPEVLYALGIGAFLLLHWRSRPRMWVDYLVALAGALIPIVPLLIHNQLAFGAFWKTAYALTKEQTGFGLAYFRTNAVHYIGALQGDGIGLITGLGLAGMGLLCADRRHRPLGVLLLLIVVPSTLLYMSYYWAPQRMNAGILRFLLPTFPCYILGSLFAARLLCRSEQTAAAKAALALPLCLYVVWGIFTTRAETLRSTHQRSVLACVTEELSRTAQENDIVLSSSSILQHLDYVRRWRLADVGALRPQRAGGRTGRRLADREGPSPMQAEKMRKRFEQYAGLGPLGLRRIVARDLREWAGTHDVYFLGREDELNALQGWHFGKRHFEIVARISLPEAPPSRERRQGRAGFGGPGPRPGPGAPDAAGRARLPPAQAAPRLEAPQRFRFAGGQRPGQGPGGRPQWPRQAGPGGPMGRFRKLSESKELVIAKWTWQPT